MFENLINKKVIITLYDRDNNGSILKNKTTKIQGICTFAGLNEILNLNQITINRIPIFESDIINIEIKK